MRGCSQLVFGPLLAVAAFGQTTPPAAVPILQEATLPMYPPIAKAAHVTGKVIVRVTVKGGLVEKTDVLSKPDVASGGRLLETPTVENLKTWHFAANVARTFTVTYTCRLERNLGSSVHLVILSSGSGAG